MTRIVYAGGFGNAKRDSIFRAGSISKLFNALAVMQLVELGKIDLDAPIQSYGPQFTLVVPFESAAYHPAAALVPSVGHDPRSAGGRLLRS